MKLLFSISPSPPPPVYSVLESTCTPTCTARYFLALGHLSVYNSKWLIDAHLYMQHCQLISVVLSCLCTFSSTFDLALGNYGYDRRISYDVYRYLLNRTLMSLGRWSSVSLDYSLLLPHSKFATQECTSF